MLVDLKPTWQQMATICLRWLPVGIFHHISLCWMFCRVADIQKSAHRMMRKDVYKMFEIKGKVMTAICYAKVVEDEAIEQIRRML